MSDAPFDMPPEDAGFDARGGWLVNRLCTDLGLTPNQAAGIVGNFGGESGLDPNINERRPMVAGSRGGFGWEQATGPRRLALEKWAADHNLEVGTDEANYGYLLFELVDDPLVRGDGTEIRALDRLRQTTTLEAAVYTFEVLFERPSDPQGGLKSREGFAQRALAAATNLHVPTPPVDPDHSANELNRQELRRILREEAPIPAASPPAVTEPPAPPRPPPVPAVRAAPGVMVAASAGATGALAVAIQYFGAWPLHAPNENQAMALASLIVLVIGGMQHLWQSKRRRRAS